MREFLEQFDILPRIGSGSRPLPHSHGTEREVVELFDELRDRMLRYLLGFGLAMPDCEEIVQETFLALFLHLRKGRSRRNLRSWLFRVAHNLALKNLQSASREARHLVDCDGELVSASTPEELCSENQTQQRLRSVFYVLPEESRRCLSLRAEGFTYREIALILDMSLGAVAISLARSLSRMAEAAKR